MTTDRGRLVAPDIPADDGWHAAGRRAALVRIGTGSLPGTVAWSAQAATAPVVLTPVPTAELAPEHEAGLLAALRLSG